MDKPENFIMMPIPTERFTAVCAVLASGGLAAFVGGAMDGVSFAALTAKASAGNVAKHVSAKQDTDGPSAISETATQENPASAGTGATATNTASLSDDSGEVDAHGHPWSADLHASTKGKTKDGLWRMKVGVSRPDPLPGFPKDEQSAGTGTASATSTNSATLPTATGPENGPTATSGSEGGDEDEFAAFRAAAAASDATDNAAAAAVPVRQFSDADLGALCNQAAVKLGDPGPIKEIIAKFIPEGQVAHSRNIPTDQREAFAQEVEAKAGIQFAG